MPEIRLRRIEGSLVTALDPEQLAPGEFAVLENFIFDAGGLPVTRGGQRTWITTALQEDGVDTPINGLYHFQAGAPGFRRRSWVLCYAGSKVYKTEQDNAWDEIYSGLEVGLVPSWATLRDWVVFASDSDIQRKPLIWSGTGAMRDMTQAPSLRLIATHANRLWGVDAENPSLLWYSAPFNPNGWQSHQGAGFIPVGNGDGNTISALVPGFAGEMIVFKDGVHGGATYRLQGSSQLDFAVTPLSATLGAIGSAQVSLVGDRDVYFTSRRGIHSLQRTFQHGDLESAFIDHDISNIWLGLTESQKYRAVSVDDYPHDSWWLFYDSDGDLVNDSALIFNYQHLSRRGTPKISSATVAAASAAIVRDASSGRLLLITGGTDGLARIEHVEEIDSVEWSLSFQPFLAEEEFRVKSWREAWLNYDNWGDTTMVASWYGDNRPPTSTTISLNPAQFPAPFTGVRLNEMRGTPAIPSNIVLQLREGGTRLNLSLSGSASRLRLRSLQLIYDTGRLDATAWGALQQISARNVWS
jgi:hypothetical protein